MKCETILIYSKSIVLLLEPLLLCCSGYCLCLSFFLSSMFFKQNLCLSFFLSSLCCFLKRGEVNYSRYTTLEFIQDVFYPITDLACSLGADVNAKDKQGRTAYEYFYTSLGINPLNRFLKLHCLSVNSFVLFCSSCSMV